MNDLYQSINSLMSLRKNTKNIDLKLILNRELDEAGIVYNPFDDSWLIKEDSLNEAAIFSLYEQYFG